MRLFFIQQFFLIGVLFLTGGCNKKPELQKVFVSFDIEIIKTPYVYELGGVMGTMEKIMTPANAAGFLLTLIDKKLNNNEKKYEVNIIDDSLLIANIKKIPTEVVWIHIRVSNIGTMSRKIGWKINTPGLLTSWTNQWYLLYPEEYSTYLREKKTMSNLANLMEDFSIYEHTKDPIPAKIPVNSGESIYGNLDLLMFKN